MECPTGATNEHITSYERIALAGKFGFLANFALFRPPRRAQVAFFGAIRGGEPGGPNEKGTFFRVFAAIRVAISASAILIFAFRVSSRNMDVFRFSSYSASHGGQTKMATDKKAPTKSQIFANIAEATELSKKDVAAVFDALTVEISRSVGRNGAGQFTIPGLCKVVVQRKPATKARKGVPNPFKPGELMDVAAKPARNVVKVRPLKALKDMV